MIELYLFEWEELLMVLMGFAAMAYIVVEYKRERADRYTLMEIVGRLARLEANSDDSVALEGRLAALEAAAAVSERHEERLAGLQERTGRLELFWDIARGRAEDDEDEDEDDEEDDDS